MTARIFRAIFKGKEGGLEEIKEAREGFGDEKSIQRLIGENLEVIFPGHEFIKHEFVLAGKKIDTVAFNTKSKSFVLIEYKKSKVQGVLEQAIDYLRLLDERRADFLQLYQEIHDKSFNKKDIAWGENKAVIISPSFTDHQLSMAKGSKEPIELYQILKYENGIMAFGRVAHQKQNSRRPSSEEKISEEKHLEKASPKTLKVYNKLKSNLFKEMPDLKIEPMKLIIKMLNKHSKTICTVEVLQNSLNLSYTTNQLKIERNDLSFVKDMIEPKKIGNHGSGKYMSKIKSEEDVSKALQYVKQVHSEKNKSTTSGQRRGGTARRRGQRSEEEYLRMHGTDATKMLYRELCGMISSSIPGAKIKAAKRYIGWRSPATGKLFCSIEILKNSLNVIYNTEELDVPEVDMGFVKRMIKNGKEISMVGPGNYRSKINSKEDLAKAIPYIKDVHLQKIK